MSAKKKKKQGFACLTKEERAAISSLGGKTAHKNGKAHQFTSLKGTQAGKKGGKSISKNRRYMAEIGRKGGLKSQQTQRKNNGQ